MADKKPENVKEHDDGGDSSHNCLSNADSEARRELPRRNKGKDNSKSKSGDSLASSSGQSKSDQAKR